MLKYYNNKQLLIINEKCYFKHRVFIIEYLINYLTNRSALYITIDSIFKAKEMFALQITQDFHISIIFSQIH